MFYSDDYNAQKVKRLWRSVEELRVWRDLVGDSLEQNLNPSKGELEKLVRITA